MKLFFLQPNKVTAIICFPVFCIWALIFGWFCWRYGDDLLFPGTYLFPGFFAFSVVGACYLGYRVFFVSNELSRLNEERKTFWWNNHHRLRVALNVMGWLIVLYFVVKDISEHFYKH